MNKITNLSLSGTMMILAGIVMLASESIGISTSKILIPALFALGGVFAILFARANTQHKTASQFHLLQGVGMIVFAGLILMIPKSLEDFLMYISFFVLTFGFIEILFGFIILNSGSKLNIGILISRLVSGFLSLIGAAILLMTLLTDEKTGLLIAGILTFIGGLSFVIFSLKLRKMNTSI